jgi:hypothetical protein
VDWWVGFIVAKDVDEGRTKFRGQILLFLSFAFVAMLTLVFAFTKWQHVFRRIPHPCLHNDPKNDLCENLA